MVVDEGVVDVVKDEQGVVNTASQNDNCVLPICNTVIRVQYGVVLVTRAACRCMEE